MTDQNSASGVPRDRYTRAAIILHWSIAGFIIFNLGTGFFMEDWPLPLKLVAVMLHASSGLTVLVLTVARVVWRLANDPPPYPADMRRWERHVAHFAHFLLYAAMVLMPLTGWAILSAHAPPGSPGAAAEFASRPVSPPGAHPVAALPPGIGLRPAGPPPAMKVWNLFPMPKIGPIEAIARDPGGVAPLHRLHDEFVDWHGVGGYFLLGLLVLHIAGALKHQFIDRQPELARMGVGRGRRGAFAGQPTSRKPGI
jgi:cytochrome b561